MILQNLTTAANYAAHQMAVRAIEKDIPEDDARLAIAGFIESAGVAKAVAAEVFGLTDSTRSDLESSLSDLVLGRATGTNGFKKDLDLDRIAGGVDATAWARQLARSAIASKLRDLHRVDRDISVSPLSPEADASFSGVSAAFHRASTLSAEDTAEENRFNASLISLQDLKKGLRHTGQVKQNAHHLRAVYEVTAPIVVPEDAADRAWVVEQLEANPLLAYASLTAWLDIAKPTKISDLIVGLWDDFTYEEGEEISSHRPAFAHEIALAAVMLMPKPSRDIIIKAVALVTMAAAGHEWALHADLLVRSWAAVECAAFSEFKSKSRGDEGDVLMAHELAASSWPSLAKHTAQWNRSPLGTTEDAVHSFIGRVFTGIDSANFPKIG